MINPVVFNKRTAEIVHLLYHYDQIFTSSFYRDGGQTNKEIYL